MRDYLNALLQVVNEACEFGFLAEEFIEYKYKLANT